MREDGDVFKRLPSSRTFATVAMLIAGAAVGACGHGLARRSGPSRLGATARLESPVRALTIEDVFRGHAPGLEVVDLPECGGLTLRVRGGYTSLVGTRCDGDPLLIIDGAPAASVPRALKSLQPHWIERIEVLRDVASTVRYGSRGAHGVVIVTLKRRPGA